MSNTNDLLNRINAKYSTMSKGHKLLATYITDNYDKAEGENIEYSRIQKSYFWRNRSNIMLDEKEILLIAVILLESRGLTKDELQRLL